MLGKSNPSLSVAIRPSEVAKTSQKPKNSYTKHVCEVTGCLFAVVVGTTPIGRAKRCERCAQRPL